jgi:hypothetical protein
VQSTLASAPIRAQLGQRDLHASAIKPHAVNDDVLLANQQVNCA